MKRIKFISFSLILLLLTSCGGKPMTEDYAPSANIPEVSALPTDAIPIPVMPSPSPAYDPGELEEWTDVVEHLFFHPAIAYPELAFVGDNMEQGLDDWMITVDEYNKILQSVYDNDYVLVRMEDIWSEEIGENGSPQMVRNQIMVPVGKKPLVISYDDINYYQYMHTYGFTYKLILGDDGELWSWGLDPQGNEVISQDLDVITILEQFIHDHPDFSPFGAKGCLSLTGYSGILGYRTQTDRDNTSAEFEENRQAEIEAVKPIIQRLHDTGWTFGSHTWGHINLDSTSLTKIKDDTQRWFDEVGSLVGETNILFYPHGARPDGGDWLQTGEELKYLQSTGFRVFASVGIESFSFIKKDICAVICDRLHPDGTTLRGHREKYLQFYDAKDIINLDVRPEYGVTW